MSSCPRSSGVRVEAHLDQREALARLSRPGTLAVMPSTGDNSPNTVYECLERGIPFIAGNAGAIPELVSEGDQTFCASRHRTESRLRCDGIFPESGGCAVALQLERALP